MAFILIQPALTIVCTVALGLGLVVAFTMLDQLLIQDDAVPNVHEMFAVDPVPLVSTRRVRCVRNRGNACSAARPVSSSTSLVEMRQVFLVLVADRLQDVGVRQQQLGDLDG